MNFRRFPRIASVSLLFGLGVLLAFQFAIAQRPRSSEAGADSTETTSLNGSTKPVATTMAKIGSVDPAADTVEPFAKPTEQSLRARLSKLEFNVTQHASTERAFSHPLWNNKKVGVYECIVCGQDLFSSETKYRSGTGWPSFYAPISEHQVGTSTDFLIGYPRTEVHCSRCEAHLGHVFNDGPHPTGQRYCMNGASLKFVEASKEEAATEKGPNGDQAGTLVKPPAAD